MKLPTPRMWAVGGEGQDSLGVRYRRFLVCQASAEHGTFEFQPHECENMRLNLPPLECKLLKINVRAV